VIPFVSEVAPQHRPSGIEHALGHPGPCQLGSRHVSDRDPAALVDQPPGKLVQGVLSSVGDLGMDCLDLPATGVLWTLSYFAGSVGGAPLSVLKQYIENQGRG
jgi:transposase IS200 family protein